MEKEVRGVLGVGQMEKLEAEIRAGLSKVQRLEELPPEDRMGKYRKAIAALQETVNRSCSEYLRQVLFGGFIAPVNNPWFDRQLFDEWFLSEDFTARKNILLRAVRDGDAETFFAIAAELHEVTRQIVEAFGGKEDRPA